MGPRRRGDHPDQRRRRQRPARPAGAAPRRSEIVVYKNNSDGKGNSYGCHENYLLARADAVRAPRRPDHAALRHPPDLLRRRQGGQRGARRASRHVPFQLSQRADFFEEEIGLETTLKRPIVNTRDEPHADAQKYRRLHVIVGDANMSEVATYLKVGTTQIVLSMIEDDVLGDDWLLANPVPAIRQVSHDPTPARHRDARRRPPGHRPRGAVGPARGGRVKYEQHHGLAGVGEEVGADVLGALGARAHRRSRPTPSSVADQVDWVAKRRLLDGYAERHGLRSDDARMEAIDLQYHDLRPERCLARRAGLASRSSTPERGAVRP